MKQKVCCIIGHRKIEEPAKVKENIQRAIEALINAGVDTFIFGDHSQFNTLCHEIVTQARLTYPHIRRVYYRKDYPEIGAETESFFLNGYEESVYPKNIELAGRAVYIARNKAMIRDSDYCLFYYKENLAPEKSGTKIAYLFAKRERKQIINVYEKG